MCQRLGILPKLHLLIQSLCSAVNMGFMACFKKSFQQVGLKKKKKTVNISCFRIQEQISGSISAETCRLISVRDAEHISFPPWQIFNRFLFTLNDALWPSGNNYTVYYSDLCDCCGLQQKTTINIQLRPLFSWFSLSSEGRTCSKLRFFLELKKNIAQKTWLTVWSRPSFCKEQWIMILIAEIYRG